MLIAGNNYLSLKSICVVAFRLLAYQSLYECHSSLRTFLGHLHSTRRPAILQWEPFTTWVVQDHEVLDRRMYVALWFLEIFGHYCSYSGLPEPEAGALFLSYLCPNSLQLHRFSTMPSVGQRCFQLGVPVTPRDDARTRSPTLLRAPSAVSRALFAKVEVISGFGKEGSLSSNQWRPVHCSSSEFQWMMNRRMSTWPARRHLWAAGRRHGNAATANLPPMGTISSTQDLRRRSTTLKKT